MEGRGAFGREESSLPLAAKQKISRGLRNTPESEKKSLIQIVRDICRSMNTCKGLGCECNSRWRDERQKNCDGSQTQNGEGSIVAMSERDIALGRSVLVLWRVGDHVVGPQASVDEAVQQAVVNLANFPRRVEEAFCAIRVRQAETGTVCDAADQLSVVEESCERSHFGVVVRTGDGRRRVARELDGVFGEEEVRELRIHERYDGHARDEGRRFELRAAGVVEDPYGVKKQNRLRN